MSLDRDATQESQLRAQPVMRGRGYYNAHSQVQYLAMRAGLPYLAKAATRVPLPEAGSVFVVADYASSEGQNSLEPMRLVVETIRRRISDPIPITVVHNDQPANDFSSLFTLVTSSEESYLQGTSNVFSYAVGRSFFEQVFPAHQVSLGWSSSAAMFLSSTPRVIPNHFYSPCTTGDVHESFSNQARHDWERFLLHRATELRAGGRLVLLFVGSDERGLFGGEGLVNFANQVLQEMVQEGKLRPQEYEAMAMPVYLRNLVECEEPFSRGRVGQHLMLEEASLVILSDPLWDEYEKTGSAETFASGQTGFFRAWSESSLFSALEKNRSQDMRRELADQFFQRVEEKIISSPNVAKCEWRMPILLIAKKGE